MAEQERDENGRFAGGGGGTTKADSDRAALKASADKASAKAQKTGKTKDHMVAESRHQDAENVARDRAARTGDEADTQAANYHASKRREHMNAASKSGSKSTPGGYKAWAEKKTS